MSPHWQPIEPIQVTSRKETSLWSESWFGSFSSLGLPFSLSLSFLHHIISVSLAAHSHYYPDPFSFHSPSLPHQHPSLSPRVLSLLWLALLVLFALGPSSSCHVVTSLALIVPTHLDRSPPPLLQSRSALSVERRSTWPSPSHLMPTDPDTL